MPGSGAVQLAATTSQTRAGAWVGGLIVLGIIAAIVALAVVNSRTKQRLRRSDLEVSRLRAHLSRVDVATAPASTPAGGAPRTPAADAYRTGGVPAEWFPDPTGATSTGTGTGSEDGARGRPWGRRHRVSRQLGPRGQCTKTASEKIAAL